MLTFDIPINIRVNAETEQQAEDFVAKMVTEGMRDGPALTNPFITWDFVDFISEEEADIKEACDKYESSSF